MNNALNYKIISQLKKYKSDLHPSELLSRSVPILIGIFIFFNPFPHTTSIKEICFYLALFIVIILILFKKTKLSFRSPLLLPFSLFVFWALAGIFFAVDKENSIHDLYSHLLRYIMLYYLIINFYDTKKHLVGLTWIIIISTAIFSTGALYYYYYTLGHSISSRFGVIQGVNGFTGTQNVNIGLLSIWAAILALGNIFSTSRWILKTILVICLFPLGAAIILTQNRCFVVAFTMSLLFLFFNKKTMTLVLLILLAVVFVTAPLPNRMVHNLLADNIRIGINLRSIEIIKDYPVFGIGYGHQTFGKHLDLNYYNNKIPDRYKLNDLYPDPHNILLDIAIRTGVIGLGLYLFIIFNFSKMWWQCIKHKKNAFIQNWGYCLGASFIAYLVTGLLQPLIGHMPEVMLFTIFSMMTILWRIDNRPDFIETV